MPIRWALLLLSLAVGLGCAAGGSSGPAPERAVETVARLQWEWVRALERGDVAAIERILAPDFVNTAADGNILNRTEELAPLRTGDVKFDRATLEDLRVRVFGDSAVAAGVGVFSGTVRGRPFEGRERFTDTWVRREGRWVVVASHNSRVPAGSQGNRPP